MIQIKTKPNEIKVLKKQPIHPGKIVKTFLKNENISYTELAKVLGVSKNSVMELVQGRRRISNVMACKLSQYMGNSEPHVWLQIQFQYDVWEMYNNPDCKFGIKPYVRPKISDV